jgi:hypothetical protein
MAAATTMMCGVLALALAGPVEGVAEGTLAGGVARRLPPVDLGDPAELVPPETPPVIAARRLADGGRFDAAAAAFEALARAQGDVRLRYQAGVMRAKAGQNALAARHFQAVLEQSGGLQGSARQYVADRLAAAQARLIGVRIAASEGVGGASVPAELLARAELRLEPVIGAADPGAVIVLANYGGEEVLLDRTPVVVHLAIPGYASVSQLRSVGDGETTWTLAVARQKVTVDLRFAPERGLRGAKLRISPTDGANVPAIDQTLEAPSLTVMLTSGNWQVDVTSRRHEAHTSLLVTPGMRVVQVDLQRRGRVGDQEFADRSDVISAVMGGGFILSALTGAGLLIAGGVKEQRARRRNDDVTQAALLGSADGGGDPALTRVEEAYPTAALHRDIGRAFNLTTAGAVVAMSSTGALLAGLTVGARVKRRAAFLEMGVGALLTAGGAVWLAYTVDRQGALLAPTDPEERRSWSDLRSVSRHRAGSAIVLGMGAGLLFFPAIAVIGDAAHQRRMRRRGLSVAPSFGGDRAMVTLRGQF